MPAAYLETLNPQQRRAAEHGVEDKHTIPGEPLLISGLRTDGAMTNYPH